MEKGLEMTEKEEPGLDILVADDEPHIARSLHFIFKREGYIVVMCRGPW